MIQDPRIIENIKKLRELGMSDKDIKDNLIKMNLSPSDCEELLAAASGTVVPEKTEDETPKEKENKPKEKTSKIPGSEKKEIPKSEDTEKILDAVAELPDNLFDDENPTTPLEENNFFINSEETELPDITKGLDLDKLNNTNINIDEEPVMEEEKEEAPKPIKKRTASMIKSIDLDKLNPDKLLDTKPSEELKSLDSSANLWSSGIATTINSRLNEIDSKQEEFEELVKKRISEELDKLKKIQETSKQLLIQRIDEQLTEKTTAVSAQLTKQLAQIKVELIKINKKSEQMSTGKQEVEELIKNLQAIQAQVIENNNKSQENINKMIISTTTKLNTKMKEINDILALQSKITQGLIKNTQSTVVEEVKKLEAFKTELEGKINPQQMYDKLNQLETFKQQLSNRYETIFENIKKEFLLKAKDAFKEEIETQLKEMKNLKETIVAKTDPKLISDKIEELDSFQNQLIAAIDEKISQSFKIYQAGVNQEMTNKSKALDEEVNKMENAMLKLLDAEEKMNDLDKFKEQFIAIIDKNIEKMNQTYSKFEKKLLEMEEKQKQMM